MLLRLNIKNFAILENIELDFHNGLTVLSGESGAGKSMIIEAINYLYGKRASQDDIRYDTEGSLIEGVFDFPDTPRISGLLEQFNIGQDELYIVRREIMQNKKSIIKINNHMITLTQLRTIMEEVVSIFAQSSQQDALDKGKHILYLDKFLDIQNEAIFDSYQKDYSDYLAITQKIEELEYRDRNRIESLELYQHQFQEISALELKDNEESALEEELEYLMNFEKVFDSLRFIKDILSSERSPQGTLYDLNQQLESLSQYNSEFKQYGPTIMDSYFIIQELESHITANIASMDYDEQRLNDIQMRLNSINFLKRKYNKTYEELILYMEELDDDIQELENISHSFEKLNSEKEALLDNMEENAKALHNFRNERKHFLESRIQKELMDLEMSQVDFEIKIKQGKFHQLGYSDIQFMISTNRGEPLKEMNKVASGGEMSRVMLAVKSIFTEYDQQSLLILDEIDTGVSGGVATKMAEKMKILSRGRQVLVISHLPQAAAISDQHLYITKESDKGRTITNTEYLTDDDHIYEIARMLSGQDVTEAALLNARSLIKTNTTVD
ncbi:DNA repair protein RecN [Salinicoccus sp. YB14-2]|uniref:DNA repair protein RecN n=1 Tax=Salinicoccus sp. YB14-2 TaxID=1572701 RepID=UPI00068EE343|nr:DNA repair protein RecN [Salinicoccus sp. YB14-2]